MAVPTAEVAPARPFLGNCYCPRWTATADGLWMTPMGRAQRASDRAVLPNGADMVNTTGLPFNIAGGPRADVIYHSNSKMEIEFSGFLIDGFHAMDTEDRRRRSDFQQRGAHRRPVPVMAFDYLSRLYSTEINLRRPAGDNITLFLGVRWIELEEQLNGSGTGRNFLTINTMNHMYGVQAGADATLWAPSQCSPFRIDGLVKAGVYDDRGDQNSSGITTAGLPERHSSFDDHVAFYSEASLTACYQLSKHVAARVGCEAAWMQSVAWRPTN